MWAGGASEKDACCAPTQAYAERSELMAEERTRALPPLTSHTELAAAPIAMACWKECGGGGSSTSRSGQSLYAEPLPQLEVLSMMSESLAEALKSKTTVVKGCCSGSEVRAAAAEERMRSPPHREPAAAPIGGPRARRKLWRCGSSMSRWV